MSATPSKCWRRSFPQARAEVSATVDAAFVERIDDSEFFRAQFRKYSVRHSIPPFSLT